MVHIEETKQYNVRAQGMLSHAFERAYSRYADTQEAAPPDAATMIFSIISFVLVIGMLLLTAYSYPKEVFWYLLSGVFALLIGRVIYRYMLARREYLKAAGKPSTISQKKVAFFNLFGGIDEVPEITTAADLQDRVRPLLGKQKDQIYNTALRTVSEELVTVNNPAVPLCKLITPLKEVFTQSRQRFYFKEEDGNLIFFDADWMNPKGQIRCEASDVLSFGKYTNYAGSINSAGGGKIRSDAVILEIQNDSESIYFEFHQDEYDVLRKRLPGKKEKK